MAEDVLADQAPPPAAKGPTFGPRAALEKNHELIRLFEYVTSYCLDSYSVSTMYTYFFMSRSQLRVLAWLPELGFYKGTTRSAHVHEKRLSNLSSRAVVSIIPITHQSATQNIPGDVIRQNSFRQSTSAAQLCQFLFADNFVLFVADTA